MDRLHSGDPKRYTTRSYDVDRQLPNKFLVESNLLQQSLIFGKEDSDMLQYNPYSCLAVQTQLIVINR